MKDPRTLALTLALGALASGVGPAQALASPPEDGQDRSWPRPTELLVDLRDDTTDADEAELEAKLGGLDLRLNSPQAADERLFIATAGEDQMPNLLARLANDPRVEHAEPNYIYGLLDDVAEPAPDVEPARGAPRPNDPLYARQWSFPMIGVQEAWADSDGTGVVVAVIDTGVAFEKHKRFRRVEDLDEHRFVEGYNFLTDNKHANDDHGHGTHVAGTIAQTTFNAKGVAGIAFNAKIMPLKVLSKRGFGTAGDIADAIRFAADEGAHVMNLSLGGGPRSRVMESAVAYARRKGVLVICAAGNNGRPRVEYPAAYQGAFAVSSVGPTKQLAFYSSYGPQIAVAGPGGDKNIGGDDGGILQNTIDPNRVDKTDQYLSFQGTSMATPHVAGVAALVMGAGVTNADQVEAILRETAEDLGRRGRDDRFGHGLVNAAQAVKSAKSTRGGWAHLFAALAGLFGLALTHGGRLGRAALLTLARPSTLLGAALASAGLGFLPGVLGLALPLWDIALVGLSGHFVFLWASVLPMLALTVALVGVPKLRPALVGLSAGWAAHLFITAWFGGADVVGLPGVAGWLDRGWLVLQAALLMGLSLSILRVHSTSSK